MTNITTLNDIDNCLKVFICEVCSNKVKIKKKYRGLFGWDDSSS